MQLANAFQIQDEKEKAKQTYDALNSQLIEELPKLLTHANKLYSKCVTEFILLRKLFIGRVTKELLSLMDVSVEKTLGC